MNSPQNCNLLLFIHLFHKQVPIKSDLKFTGSPRFRCIFLHNCVHSSATAISMSLRNSNRTNFPSDHLARKTDLNCTSLTATFDFKSLENCQLYFFSRRKIKARHVIKIHVKCVFMEKRSFVCWRLKWNCEKKSCQQIVSEENIGWGCQAESSSLAILKVIASITFQS